MLSLTTSSTHFVVLPCSLPRLSPRSHALPSILFVTDSRRRRKKRIQKLFVPLSFGTVKESCGSQLRFSQVLCGGGGPGSCSGFARRCLNWDSEGDFDLEADILEFMKESRNPAAFPGKKELVEAGRMDLVEAIKNRGGWLSLGWDLSDEEEEEEMVQENVAARVSDSSSADNEFGSFFNSLGDGTRSSGMVSSFSGNSSQSASSSGRSLETATEDESGIEGILNRLEKQRNLTFGVGLKAKGNDSKFPTKCGKDDWQPGTLQDTAVAGLERSSQMASLGSSNHNYNDFGGKLGQNRSFFDVDGFRNSRKPDMWRTWSIQRAGFSDANFEAAEIASLETRTGGEILEIREVPSEPSNTRKELSPCHKEINHNEIRSRLQHLELELSSVLHILRLNADEVMSQKDHESSSEELRKLSDAWEFQENEIMNAQDRLRSIRAKLTVIEGKMTLAIIDAQKMVEVKQKRIDDARRALQLLCTTWIVWPNSASEVLLTGSFDGWATQRKMEESSTGVFSLCLKLYPGRYEIKFIVDGEWRVDPLRPVVNDNGYENNLLIIT
ncbi:hypothetical protein FH972_009044 [Carpinus fangiana]|uniref:AMP-activated protein kinase glycogen-binding domain-containing protein n=1 Tax=Carpinus fangiana TaxID=176857 RepID=A0A5N6R0Q0_9ROSI|nr:hypothetical protein FH972_009044 [Carpinus fangiana]